MHGELNLRRRTRIEKGAQYTFFTPVLLTLFFATLGCHGLQIAWVAQSVLRQARLEIAVTGFDVPEPSETRVLLYEYELGPGWVVTSADLTEWQSEVPLVCENRCWLFFVDFIPTAYFGHPTAIALYDLDLNSIDLRLASWWPALTGPQDARVTSIFSTFAQRTSPDDLVHPLPKDGSMPSVPEPIPDLVPRRYLWVSPLTVPPEPVVPDPEDRSAVWAILAQGYSDMTDNFFDDVSRSAKVMDGMRVPSSNVEIVQPLGSAVSGALCEDSLNQAVNDLLWRMRGRRCEEFILYYSSHAVPGKLKCLHDINETVQYWEGPEIEQTLKYFGPYAELHLGPPVVCDKVTVIFQSCYAGSFLTAVNNGLVDVPHVFVTASDAVSVAYTDRDDNVAAGIDDDNEGDVGPEFSSGFWEAYGREVADGIDASTKDLDVDLAEAFTYAKEHDVTHSKFGTNPQLFVVPSTGLVPKTLVRTKENLTAAEHAGLKITSVTLDNNSGVAGKVVMPDTNWISVDIDNTSNHYAPVITMRIVLKTPADVEREVGRTELVAGLDAYERITSKVEWRLKVSFPLENYDDICVVADSPAVGSGNAEEYCLGSLPVEPNPNLTPTPTPKCCLMGCT